MHCLGWHDMDMYPWLFTWMTWHGYVPCRIYSMTENLVCSSSGKCHDFDLFAFFMAFVCHSHCRTGWVAHTSVDSQVSVITIISSLKTRELGTSSRDFFVWIDCLLSHSSSFESFAWRKTKLEANRSCQHMHAAHRSNCTPTQLYSPCWTSAKANSQGNRRCLDLGTGLVVDCNDNK